MTRPLDLSVPFDVPELADLGLTLDRAALGCGVLVLGGTGSGKSASIVSPLLRALLAERAVAPVDQRSCVVCIDPKRELGATLRAGCADSLEIDGPETPPLDVFAALNRDALDAGEVVDRYMSLSDVSMDSQRDGFWRVGARNLLHDCVSIDLHIARVAGAPNDAHIRRSLFWRGLAGALRAAERIAKAEARVLISPRRPISRYLLLLRMLARDGGSTVPGPPNAALVQRVITQHAPDLALPALSQLPTLASETGSSLVATCSALVGALSSEHVQRALRLDVLPPLRTTPVLSMMDCIRNGSVMLYQPSTTSAEGMTIARAVKAATYDAILQGAACTPERAVQRLVAIVIDEAHEVLTTTGVSDARFLAVGRAFGSAPILATQSISAIRDRLPMGSHDAVRAIITNVETRVQLATADPDTLHELRALIPPPPIPGPHLTDVRSPAQFLPGEAVFFSRGGWGIGRVRLRDVDAGCSDDRG